MYLEKLLCVVTFLTNTVTNYAGFTVEGILTQ